MILSESHDRIMLQRSIMPHSGFILSSHLFTTVPLWWPLIVSALCFCLLASSSPCPGTGMWPEWYPVWATGVGGSCSGLTLEAKPLDKDRPFWEGGSGSSIWEGHPLGPMMEEYSRWRQMTATLGTLLWYDLFILCCFFLRTEKDYIVLLLFYQLLL